MERSVFRCVWQAMKKIISASAAARLIGCDPQVVRERLRKGIWKFGRAIPPKEHRLNWTYEVYPEALEEYLKGE